MDWKKWNQALDDFKNDAAARHFIGIVGVNQRGLTPLNKALDRKWIIELLEQGLDDKTIADKVKKSEKTVYRIRVEWVNGRI